MACPVPSMVNFIMSGPSFIPVEYSIAKRTIYRLKQTVLLQKKFMREWGR